MYEFFIVEQSSSPRPPLDFLLLGLFRLELSRAYRPQAPDCPHFCDLQSSGVQIHHLRASLFYESDRCSHRYFLHHLHYPSPFHLPYPIVAFIVVSVEPGPLPQVLFLRKYVEVLYWI